LMDGFITPSLPPFFVERILTVGPLGSTSLTSLHHCRVGGGAHLRASLRPPLKRYGRFYRIPLSQSGWRREKEGINMT
jgi:hypothetical protein